MSQLTIVTLIVSIALVSGQLEPREPVRWQQIFQPINSLINSAKDVLANSNTSANGVVGTVAGNAVDVVNTAVNLASNTLNSSTGVFQDLSGSAVHAVNGPVVSTLNDTLNQATNILNFNPNRKPGQNERGL